MTKTEEMRLTHDGTESILTEHKRKRSRFEMYRGFAVVRVVFQWLRKRKVTEGIRELGEIAGYYLVHQAQSQHIPGPGIHRETIDNGKKGIFHVCVVPYGSRYHQLIEQVFDKVPWEKHSPQHGRYQLVRPDFKPSPPVDWKKKTEELRTDPPVVLCEAMKTDPPTWRFWCKHCRRHHTHSVGEGHRVAHCHDPDSPFHGIGYVLKLAENTRV